MTIKIFAKNYLLTQLYLTMNKFTLLTLIVLFMAISSNSMLQEKEKYSLVKIYANTSADFDRLSKADLHLDHAIRKDGFTEAWLSESEIDLLRKSGTGYEIIVGDWEEYYGRIPKMTNNEIANALKESKDAYNVSHSIYGSMGGFLKFNEVIGKLDTMRIEYPGLISSKFSIGTSNEGRTIWAVKVTLNPDAPNTRPQVWYHSLIHAREPESMEHLIYYIYWLLENYNSDPLAKYILENRELYFTPVLNPDGYVYNETTNPNGGGMWRKNRRNNGSSYGIDLNRNYGIFQFWNSSNGGSSTSPSSDTYRGTSPFSEPETMAAMNFISSKNIQAVMGAHTYGNYIIKPWAWQDPTPTPDNNKFNEYLKDMSEYNKYTTGTPYQTVGYYVRGCADDFYYNDSAHSGHKIIAVTPETGNTGFWPAQADIIPFAQEMLYPDQYFSMLAGAFVFNDSLYLNKSVYTAGESGTLKIKIMNKGLLTAQNVKIVCTSSSYYLNVPITFYNIASLNSFAKDSLTFGFTISNAVPQNSAIPLTLKIYQEDSSEVFSETKYIITGSGVTIFADSAENGFSKWTTNQGWAVTTSQSHSPTRSFTDSPSGNYLNNANNSMTLNMPIDISSSPVVKLNFWHRYATESGYDYCNVEVSSNNGTSWQKVIFYDGTLSTWTQQSLDITSFANASSQMKIRFTLKADVGVVADGWYIDDIKLTSFNLLESKVATTLNLKAAPEGLYNESADMLNLRDTVSIYLRQSASPYAITDSAKGILDSGTMISLNNYFNTAAGNYYIVFKHRNCLETWSKSGGESFTFGMNTNFDFTTDSTQAFGNNMKLKGVRYCIYSGDINQDGVIDASDLSGIDNDASNAAIGYVLTDLNGDLFVDGSDMLIADNNSSNSVIKITP